MDAGKLRRSVENAASEEKTAWEEYEPVRRRLIEAVRQAYAAGIGPAELARLAERHPNTIAGWVKDVQPPHGKRIRR